MAYQYQHVVPVASEQTEAHTGFLAPKDQRSLMLGVGAGMIVMGAMVLVGLMASTTPAGQYTTQLAVAASMDLVSSEYLEETTGIVFPTKLRTRADASADYQLLGAGPRVKKIGPIGIKVYGVGFYVEAKGAKAALKQYEGKSASALASDNKFYDTLKTGSFNKMVDIRMKRGVGRDTMVNALVEVLLPKLQIVDAARAEELVAKFEAMFTDSGFNEGDAIRIQQVGKAMHLSVNGDKRAPVENEPSLCTAFFSIYTDADTVAPVARQHLPDLVPALFN